MTSGLKKFGLLLWKNWILQQRHKVQTLVEILVPLLFTAVLVGIRNIVSSDVISQPTIFEPFDVSDSNGTSVTKG
jgi:ATP-binding cassette subfamily A (ABC1) protein 3